jgi:hypothetical protein
MAVGNVGIERGVIGRNEPVLRAIGVPKVSSRTSFRLVVEPLIECLHLFFSVRRKQVIDSYVGRRYQNRFGVRERIVAILSVVVPDARVPTPP